MPKILSEWCDDPIITDGRRVRVVASDCGRLIVEKAENGDAMGTVVWLPHPDKVRAAHLAAEAVYASLVTKTV